MASSDNGSPGSSRVPVNWADYDAVLFDLDGVITPTAEVHMRAWAEMFNAFLTEYAEDQPGDTSPYTDADYFAHVDGKPRYDGVRDFLSSRGIDLPEGADDGRSGPTVRGLGDRKNDAFNQVLERDGVTAYPGSVALLDHLRVLGTPLAVVSSSANAPAVLAAAGLADRFATVVDGRVAGELGLPGQARPRHVPARRRGPRRDRRPSPSSSRTRSPACVPVAPATSVWSSASTAAPVPRP